MSSAEPESPAAVTMGTTSEEEEEKVVLRCCDGEEFAVAVSVARKYGTISNMIDDGCVEGGVPLPNVKAPAMSMVLDVGDPPLAAATRNRGPPGGSSMKSHLRRCSAQTLARST